jgi:hypothetical protein
MNRPKTPSLVTIATFDNYSDAHIYRGKLEANGIPCHLENQNMSQLYSSIVGGIKLKVSEQDVQLALLLIKEANQNIKVKTDVNNKNTNDFFVCPGCGYLNEILRHNEKSSIVSWLTSLWKGSPKFFVCRHCDSSWTAKELLK